VALGANQVVSRVTKKQLEEQIEALGIALQAARQDAEKRVEGMQQTLDFERVQRVSAQRGLVPYVYALQALNKWMRGRTKIGPSDLERIMKRLGIWGVKVGYDPDRDVSRAVIGDES
jgi:hypothetical protein